MLVLGWVLGYNGCCSLPGAPLSPVIITALIKRYRSDALSAAGK